MLVHRLWKRGILYLGRACDGQGCKILPRLNFRKGAGEGGAREKGQVLKGLPRAAALFHGTRLLSRGDGLQGCQSLRETDRKPPRREVKPEVQLCCRVGQGANGSGRCMIQHHVTEGKQEALQLEARRFGWLHGWDGKGPQRGLR